MKSVSLFAALALAPAAALAADISVAPAPPPLDPVPVYYGYSWEGHYVGATAGWGWGSSEHTSVLGSSGEFDLDGGLAGLTVGHNWQHENVVLGIEADISWSGIDGSAAAPVCGISCSTEIDYLGTVRGRLGYALDRHLLYATGGLAYGGVDASQTGAGSSGTEIGWTAGAGLETAVSDNVTLKAEYLAVDLDDAAYTAAAPVTAETDVNHIVRGGINFRF